jgi:integrase
MKKPKKQKPLRFYFDTIFAPAKLAGRSGSTIYQYGLNLRRLDKALGRPALLSDLTDATINKAIANCDKAGNRDGNPLSKASVEKFRDNICCLWRYFNQIRVVDTFPSIPRIIVPIRIPKAWTREELNRLWEFVSRLPGDVGGVPANLWFMCLVSVLWDSGSRIKPVLHAAWDQFDLNGGWFVEKAECRKGGMSDKLARLHPETCAMLRKIIMPERDRVFNWPWSEVTLYLRWHEITRRAGIRSGTDFAFHCVRKSVATHTKIAGGNAQEALGHYDAKMTETVYIDPTQAIRGHPADVLFRLHDRRKDMENGAA